MLTRTDIETVDTFLRPAVSCGVLPRGTFQEIMDTLSVNPDEEDYLTREEVMQLLKISEQTVYKWQREGKITKYGVGGVTRYKKSEILKEKGLKHNA